MANSLEQGRPANKHVYLFRIFESVINTHHSSRSTPNIAHGTTSRTEISILQLRNIKSFTVRMRSNHLVQLHPCSPSNTMSSRLLRQGAVSQAFLFNVSTGKRAVWDLVSISVSLFLKNCSHHSASFLRLYARLPYSACIRPSKLLWPQFLSQLEEERDLQATRTSLGFLENLLLTQHCPMCLFTSTCR